MSFFFGAVRLSQAADIKALEPVVRDGVAGLLARARVERTEHMLLCMASFAHSQHQPETLPSGVSIVLVGDAALRASAALGHYATQAEGAANAIKSDGMDALKMADGTFCGMVADSAAPSVFVFTDKLGVCPAYYAVKDDVLLFSSALWPFSIKALGLDAPDVRGRVEIAIFGYPLADRTRYSAVKALSAGGYVGSVNGELQQGRYWRWDELGESGLSGDELIAGLDECMQSAVAKRASDSKRSVAFLSGGLDSRLIVAMLRKLGHEVDTLNFAPHGSLDRDLGALAATAMRTHHSEFPEGSESFAERLRTSFGSWHAAAVSKGWDERKIWSGDGGSVGMGHVYLTPAIVAAARGQGVEAAARAICEHNGFRLAPGVLKGTQRNLTELAYQGVLEELRTLSAVEPGRACHLFFMLNDQRRHLAAHFDTAHTRQHELIVPFFDARLIELIATSPVDEFLLHKAYNALMRRQDASAVSVPWQAYPGHEPSPLPLPEGARVQWEGWYSDKISKGRKLRNGMRALGLAITAPHGNPYVSRGRLALAGALTLLGAGDYSHHLDTAMAIYFGERKG